jgi:hypothetical protein
MNEKVKIKNEKLKMEAVPCGRIYNAYGEKKHKKETGDKRPPMFGLNGLGLSIPPCQDFLLLLGCVDYTPV